jgi:hypothetical protein
MFSVQENNLLTNIDKFRRNDSNLVYIFTNARDESNIAEWIAHHILLGFDKVIVFDHLSKIPINQKITTNFDNKLSIKRVDGNGNIKLNLMKRAVNIAKKNNVSWMLYLDADEFLLLKNYKNVKNYLHSFKQSDAIGINWLYFGSSNHQKQPRGLITNNFIRSEIRLDHHVKSFVRPQFVKDVTNPHFFVITNPNRYFSGNYTRMPMNPFNEQPMPFFKSSAYIAHYYTQSKEEYLKRKGRPSDDGSGIKVQGGSKIGHTTNIHKMFNNVVNNQLQYKYSRRIKDFLQRYNINL